MKNRIIELEKITAFQAHEIEELTGIVNAQERKISVLQNDIRMLKEKITGESLVKPIEEEGRPPHY